MFSRCHLALVARLSRSARRSMRWEERSEGNAATTSSVRSSQCGGSSARVYRRADAAVFQQLLASPMLARTLRDSSRNWLRWVKASGGPSERLDFVSVGSNV